VTTTITITSAGVSPADIQVAPGSRVTFINNDTRSHNMTSNPHPEHTDCTEINQVGLLTPGQSRQTGNLNTVRTCGFHDHDLPDAATLKGAIVIR
jgi:plastocyanin